jgi:hypothetical protein
MRIVSVFFSVSLGLPLMAACEVATSGTGRQEDAEATAMGSSSGTRVGINASCTSAVQCSGGEICCGNGIAGGGAQCEAQCDLGRVQYCAATSECPTGDTCISLNHTGICQAGGNTGAGGSVADGSSGSGAGGSIVDSGSGGLPDGGGASNGNGGPPDGGWPYGGGPPDGGWPRGGGWPLGGGWPYGPPAGGGPGGVDAGAG